MWTLTPALAPFTRSLRVISVISGAALSVCSTMLPRKPEVSFNCRPVDSQWTVSALSRYTWTWIYPLLRHALLHDDLDAEDIPHPDFRLRSQTLLEKCDTFKQRTSLFWSLVTMYKQKLSILWFVTLIRCVASLLPFWFMFRILGVLEDTKKASHHSELLPLIVYMAVLNLIDSVRVSHLQKGFC